MPNSRHARQIPPKRDPGADPFATLGLAYGASIEDVRAAYLRLVKELHPDGRLHDPAAAERLKAINKAYDDLKALRRRATAATGRRRASRRRAALFAIGFVTSSIACAGLYYAAFVRPHGPRPVAEAGRTEPGPSVRGDDLTTGSISEPAKTEAAAVQAEATRPARLHEAEDDAAWAETEREGTSVALHRYLGRYPAGRHAQRATRELATVVTFEVALGNAYDRRDAASAEATKQALRRYLAVYPKGRFAAEARGKLAAIDAAEQADAEAAEAQKRADREAWSEVEQAATIEALRGYLHAHPQGIHAAAAQHAIALVDAAKAREREDHLAWAEAQQDATEQALRRYLDAFPDGTNAAAARQKLASLTAAPETTADAAKQRDDADWVRARRRNTKAAYAAYLSAHPQGHHAESARTSIAELASVPSKAAPPARVQAGKPGLQPLRTDTIDAPASAKWPSADEPFIGPDTRMRQR